MFTLYCSTCAFVTCLLIQSCSVVAMKLARVGCCVRWHGVLVMYEDKTVVVSVDHHVERMTLEHNSWRFRLAPSIWFGGARQPPDHGGGCCDWTPFNLTDGNAPCGIYGEKIG